MLLNRAHDAEWHQEGIYVAFSPALSDPGAWSAPQRLLAGGSWYPQVVGLEPGIGTDKIAGERARLFVSGRSHYFIRVCEVTRGLGAFESLGQIHHPPQELANAHSRGAYLPVRPNEEEHGKLPLFDEPFRPQSTVPSTFPVRRWNTVGPIGST